MEHGFRDDHVRDPLREGQGASGRHVPLNVRVAVPSRLHERMAGCGASRERERLP